MSHYQTQSHEELSRIVRVTADTTARWDGKDIDLRKGAEIPYGLAMHFHDTLTVEITIQDVTPKERPSKEIVNPLEENDRGEAFAGLKRGRKKEE